MKKIEEILKNSIRDKDSLKLISIYSNMYPSKLGYKIECFMSQMFIRITIYK